jgi:hypothetical protein
MASCPPDPFVEDNLEVPFGHGPTQMNGTAPKTWDLSKPDLANLLDLSKRLNLDGEITPVMAWGMILAHPRFSELRTEDFGNICQELGGKVRCYGYVFPWLSLSTFVTLPTFIRFGAVLEEFEVRDALESVFYTKTDMNLHSNSI